MKKLLLSLLALTSGILVYLIYHRNDWRFAYTEEVTDHIEDILYDAKKEFFDHYPREETRRNVFKSFSYIDYDYMGNLESLKWDIGWVARIEVERMISDDPEGKEAYLELQKFLLNLEDMIERLSPEPDFIDNLNGGIWGERKRNSDCYDRPESNEYTLYDPLMTPIIMSRRRYPEQEVSSSLLRSIIRLKTLREERI